MANTVVENLGAAAGEGIEAGVSQAGKGVANAQVADFRDVHNLRRGEAMAPDVEVGFNGAEQILIPFDFELGMEAALHQNTGAAEVQRLLNLRKNDFFGM